MAFFEALVPEVEGRIGVQDGVRRSRTNAHPPVTAMAAGSVQDRRRGALNIATVPAPTRMPSAAAP